MAFRLQCVSNSLMHLCTNVNKLQQYINKLYSFLHLNQTILTIIIYYSNLYVHIDSI